VNKTPFERDIHDQPAALRAFAASAPPAALHDVELDRYDRIVLTGMGSSHFAALPTWRRLVDAGLSAWWVDAGQLLDAPGLITPDTLLIATSQSGASAEVETLLNTASAKPRTVIGVTNDPASVLAGYSDILLELHSGAESTVSTKSYLNTLAAHGSLTAALLRRPCGTEDVTATADLLERTVPDRSLTDVAEQAVELPGARMAFVGNQDHAATAMYAGLIMKEAAKVPAEGFIGGQFRHGPLELAGPGLVVTLFGTYADDTNRSLHQLATDLIATGSCVLLVGDLELPGARTVAAPHGGTLAELASGALVAQYLAVSVGTAKDIEPGAFSYAHKVTTTL
jgi:glutamine---fructose-6-phosphate transaminase (isomerizing)